MNETLLLSIREVAKLLGVSPRSVWQWADDGQFPRPLRLGRLRRWRPQDIEVWLAQQAAQAQRDGGGERS